MFDQQILMESIGTSSPPVIIIGMHRSGTSLVSRLLEECGIFQGWDKDEHNESLFFQTVNENLFRQEGADWDNPEKLYKSLQAPDRLVLAVNYVASLLEYYQKRQPEGEKYGVGSSTLWGWKDPRNTITLPVWRTLFPKSKVIHVVRNGIDVSVSLWRRETTRRYGENDPHYSRRCQTLTGCLDLWQSYVEIGRQACRQQNRELTVFYEDLILRPKAVMGAMLGFLELGERLFPHREKGAIDPSRRFAYLQDDPSKEFYRYAENHQLLQELYGDHEGTDKLVGNYPILNDVCK